MHADLNHYHSKFKRCIIGQLGGGDLWSYSRRREKWTGFSYQLMHRYPRLRLIEIICLGIMKDILVIDMATITSESS